MSSASAPLRIPRHRLGLDAFLGLFGLSIGLVTLLQGPDQPVIKIIALTISAAAAWFLWRTWALARTDIRLSGAQATWNGKIITAEGIGRVRLRHFAGVRAAKAGEGETQLTLTTADGRKLFVDSRLEGFEKLLTWLAASYGRKAFALDEKSRDVFARFNVFITSPD